MATTILPPLVLFGAMMMGSGVTAVDLMPLRALNIPYFKALDYAHFIIPGLCGLTWILTAGKWPRASPIVCCLVCVILIGLIPAYAERRVARLPVTRWLKSDERRDFEAENGFAVFQIGSNDGLFVIVAPANAARAREKLVALGICRSGRPAAG